MKHYLFNSAFTPIKEYDVFDKEVIKKDIIETLTNNPNELITHCKDYSEREKKIFAGKNIINVYEINPKTKKPSLVVTLNNKDYYKELK